MGFDLNWLLVLSPYDDLVTRVDAFARVVYLSLFYIPALDTVDREEAPPA
jgi:hypothetical protein|uniref:Uncharacterized protein n=1 Tax=Picea glauca TaxID=3330 RepID=A0A101LZV0_PICGL|nr:hypothetical protein ABT39_MTgene5369 [Picea glauca]QHR88966.1 hypothetical protein Q903MT_gene2985 [Picea sitchensis]